MATAIAPLLHPVLRALPPQERDRALREARRRPFDVFELLGIAAGLVAAALFIRHGVAPGAEPATRTALAALALAAAVGPFLLRRTRRGLQSVLAARREGRAWP